ncbi:ricin B-like lectin [Hesseltinella vesiculosa]|uniref:Ricin B-like lectin n=1 Tax=Hesseltinella vesiculosa TaxID=101127 RepID=A0A1X2GWY5_9FUNG|nr:ricin B-like lectin [Hesseltinella vesiculosa]
MTGFPENAYFYIKSASSGNVLDINEGLLTKGTKLIIWEKKQGEDADNQLWKYEGDGFLVNKKSNLVMDIDGGDLKIEKKIQQFDRKTTQTHNQRWGFRDGFVYCKADPRIVLDVKGGDDTEGTRVISYKRKLDDNVNQQWILEPVY